MEGVVNNNVTNNNLVNNNFVNNNSGNQSVNGCDNYLVLFRLDSLVNLINKYFSGNDSLDYFFLLRVWSFFDSMHSLVGYINPDPKSIDKFFVLEKNDPESLYNDLSSLYDSFSERGIDNSLVLKKSFFSNALFFDYNSLVNNDFASLDRFFDNYANNKSSNESSPCLFFNGLLDDNDFDLIENHFRGLDKKVEVLYGFRFFPKEFISNADDHSF